MKEISGGVTAPKGFCAAGIHCGVKQAMADGNSPLVAGQKPEDWMQGKKDLALILSDCPCAAAAVYTLNRVKAAPIHVTMEHLKDGTARGVIVNSGNANACAPKGLENALAMCAFAAAATGLRVADFAVASTGVIGQSLNMAAIERGVPALAAQLSPDGSGDAADAIMTTDLKKKEFALTLPLGGVEVTIGAIAKGSGMIHPNMGTMLAFVTTDCAISTALLSKALGQIVPRTFNRVTVDGDTSTNDMCLILANGRAENPLIDCENTDFAAFTAALHAVCEHLARAMAADGEGATKLITCTVTGAADEETAACLSKSVVGSSLVKAAMFGCDANWGRVLCAMGYAGASFSPETAEMRFRSAGGEVLVCRAGAGVDFDEGLARKVLTQDEVCIDIALRDGDGAATCWGCDLTYDYVRINGDYRS